LHYVRYVLKVDELYHNVLTHKNFDIPSKFIDKTIRYHYINSKICRLTRKYKGNIPYSCNAKSFSVDNDMYNEKIINNEYYIEIMTTVKSKRISIKLTDKYIYTGNLKVILNDNNTIQIHKPLKIESKKLTDRVNVLGIDKGYKYLLAVSNNKFYGEILNDFLSKETERLKVVNAKRNVLYALEKKYREEGNIKKADNILNNNLG